MNTDKKDKYTCKPDPDEVKEWQTADNDLGIAPPSVTAKSLMDSEGYIPNSGPVQNNVDTGANLVFRKANSISQTHR